MGRYKFEKGLFSGKLVERNLPLINHWNLPRDFGGKYFSIKYGKTGFFVYDKRDETKSLEYKELDYMQGLNYFVVRKDGLLPTLYNLSNGSSIVLSDILNNDFAVSKIGEVYPIKEGKISTSKTEGVAYSNNGEYVYMENMKQSNMLIVDKNRQVRIVDNSGNVQDVILSNYEDAKIKCIDQVFDYNGKHHFVVKDKEQNVVKNSDGEILFSAPLESELSAKTGAKIKYFIAYDKEKDVSDVTLIEDKTGNIRKFQATGSVHYVELNKDRSMKIYKKQKGETHAYVTMDGKVFVELKPNGDSVLDNLKPNVKDKKQDVPDDILQQIFGNGH